MIFQLNFQKDCQALDKVVEKSYYMQSACKDTFIIVL